MADACRFALRLERDEFVLDAEAVFPGSGMTGLFGRSGSGKTTLLRCLAGLESDARGRIEICGRRWLDSRAGVALPVEVRRVGYVFQEARLFPHLDVAGNLAYARRRSSKSLLPGATHIESLFGVAGLGARRIDELSGGEARRVAIVRALSQGPELLLLDEPLTGLDTTARVQLLDALAAIDNACDAPSLFVSHDLDEILRLCDHAIVITDGRVLRAGPLDELLGDPQVVGQERYGALLEAHVFGYDTVTGLTTIESGGLRLRVPGRVEGSTVRVRVLARDVSVCLHEPTQTSVLNVVPAQVASLDEEGDHARIALDCGDRRLLALLSRHSVRQLGLVPGAAVYAQVKGAAVRPAAQSKRMVSDPGKVSA